MRNWYASIIYSHAFENKDHSAHASLFTRVKIILFSLGKQEIKL